MFHTSSTLIGASELAGVTKWALLDFVLFLQELSREEASGLFFFFVALLPFLKSAEVSRNSTKDKKLDSNQ